MHRQNLRRGFKWKWEYLHSYHPSFSPKPSSFLSSYLEFIQTYVYSAIAYFSWALLSTDRKATVKKQAVVPLSYHWQTSRQCCELSMNSHPLLVLLWVDHLPNIPPMLSVRPQCQSFLCLDPVFLIPACIEPVWTTGPLSVFSGVSLYFEAMVLNLPNAVAF